MTLHDAIQVVLQNGPMTAIEIANEVNKKQLYHRRDSAPVPSSQIHARLKNYPQYFERLGDRYKNRE